MRSGKRTVIISLDDGTGVIDTAFFDEAQNQTGSGLFTARTIIIHGHTQRTGETGISVQTDEAYDLKQIWNDWMRTVAVEARSEIFQYPPRA
jgi:error-prone DNA polymerase